MAARLQAGLPLLGKVLFLLLPPVPKAELALQLESQSLLPVTPTLAQTKTKTLVLVLNE
jgi:hypothetical protein